MRERSGEATPADGPVDRTAVGLKVYVVMRAQETRRRRRTCAAVFTDAAAAHRYAEQYGKNSFRVFTVETMDLDPTFPAYPADMNHYHVSEPMDLSRKSWRLSVWKTGWESYDPSKEIVHLHNSAFHEPEQFLTCSVMAHDDAEARAIGSARFEAFRARRGQQP